MARDGGALAIRARLKQRLATLEPTYTWELGETLIRILLFLAAAVAIIVTLAIAGNLLEHTVGFAPTPFPPSLSYRPDVHFTIGFFHFVSPIDFYTGTRWSPDIAGQFGVLPLVSGTLIIAGGACLLGIPLGLGTAVFLREYSPARVREVVKPFLEILAGIPTVVFGFFGLLTVSPSLQDWFGAQFLNGLTAIIVVGIMIVPIVSSLSEDALTAVPIDLRDGALALGATRFEAMNRVVVPGAFSGIMASCLLAFSRAVGETMIVLIVAGQSIYVELNPLNQMETMAAFITRRATGDVSASDPALFGSLFAVGFTLFLMTLVLNVLSDRLRARFREAYE